MEATVFNPIQQHLLTMFAFEKSEVVLLEVKEVLTAHFSKKVKVRFDELWENGTLDQKRLDELRGMHLRTDLKQSVHIVCHPIL